MGAQRTVLLIDDDEDFRASIRRVLELEGYAVIEAGTGEEGLRMLSLHVPDVVVLDIMMETAEEGYRINEAIKLREEYERYRAIPILMVSSILETPDERYFLQPQPDRYFTKPLDVPAFLEALNQIGAAKSRGKD